MLLLLVRSASKARGAASARFHTRLLAAASFATLTAMPAVAPIAATTPSGFSPKYIKFWDAVHIRALFLCGKPVGRPSRNWVHSE